MIDLSIDTWIEVSNRDYPWLHVEAWVDTGMVNTSFNYDGPEGPCVHRQEELSEWCWDDVVIESLGLTDEEEGETLVSISEKNLTDRERQVIEKLLEARWLVCE